MIFMIAVVLLAVLGRSAGKNKTINSQLRGSLAYVENLKAESAIFSQPSHGNETEIARMDDKDDASTLVTHFSTLMQQGRELVTGTCGNGNVGNGVCSNGQCCSQYGYCGTTPDYCSGSNGGGTSSGDTIGYYDWTYQAGSSPISNANLGVAFSGWADVNQALQDSAGTASALVGTKYLSIGGGNSNGRWNSQVLTNLNSAISGGRLAGYGGICYDIEEGDSGLARAFARSFAIAKRYGFNVLVTVSHSAPYGVGDARRLMLSIFRNTNVDLISPQLYSSGTESQNDFSTNSGVSWSDYKSSRAAVVPSIVQASYYNDAKTYFSGQGVTVRGYIQWKQG